MKTKNGHILTFSEKLQISAILCFATCDWFCPMMSHLYFEFMFITLFIVFMCCTMCFCLCRHDVLSLNDAGLTRWHRSMIHVNAAIVESIFGCQLNMTPGHSETNFTRESSRRLTLVRIITSQLWHRLVC